MRRGVRGDAFADDHSAAASNFFWRDISGLEMVVEFAEFFAAKSGCFWVNWHQRACTLGSLREAIMGSKTKSVAEVERFSCSGHVLTGVLRAGLSPHLSSIGVKQGVRRHVFGDKNDYVREKCGLITLALRIR